MPVDFTSYTDPGVYIDIVDAPITNLNGVSPTVVAIIGPSSGSGRSVTESTVLRSQYTTRLNSAGLDPTTIKVKNRFSGTEYASAVIGTLSDDIDDDDTAFTVKLSSNVPLPSTPFVVRIQDEFIKVTTSGTVSSSSTSVTFSVVTRGTAADGTADGSEPAAYVEGLPVNVWLPYDVPTPVATLSASALSTQDNLNATTTTFFIVPLESETLSVGDVLLFDDERMLVTAVTDGSESSSITVVRGINGTRATSHGAVDIVYRVEGYDYYVKMDSGSNAEFDGVDDLVVIGCLPGGRLATLDESDEVVPNAESVEVKGFSTDANQYAPELMTDLDDVKDKYGLPTTYENGTTSVNSPITLAAQLAFANGARQVYCIATDPSANTPIEGYQDAIEKISNIDAVNVILPLTTGLSMAQSEVVFNYMIEYINQQANLGVLMRAFVGLDGLTESPSSSDFAALAQRVFNSRVSVVAPSKFKLTTPTGSITVGGPYAAVAVAGLQASLQAQEPLTRKPLQPSLLFAVEDNFNAQQMIDMQAKGVLVLFNDRNGRITVRHGLTTDMTNSYTREVSVVTARDRLRDLIYDTLQTAAILGSPITSTTPDRVVANVTGALESAKRTSLIFDYADVKYRIPSDNPTAIEIRFAYRPTMPLNYVLIQFSIDTVNASVIYETVNQGGVA